MMPFLTRKTPVTPQSGQSGNALWFILLAIALLTALTIAITKTGDNVQQAGETERATVEATRIMRDGKAMQTAIQQMLARGGSENDICFDSDDWATNDYDFAACADAENRVFDPAGAGLGMPKTTATQKIIYTGSLAIDGVGTSAPDLVFILSGVGKADCLRINRMMKIDDASGNPPPISAVVSYTPFTGTYAAGNTVTAPQILQKSAGCVGGNGSDADELDQDFYHYYHVLIAR